MDAPLLARLCMALARTDKATAPVQAVGLLVKAPDTKLAIRSPWVAIVNRQTEIAASWPPSWRCRLRSVAGPAWVCAIPRVRPTSGTSEHPSRPPGSAAWALNGKQGVLA